MKILLVTPHFPPRYVGGVEFYTKRLADYLRAQGHQLEIMCAERIDGPTPGLDVVRDTAPGYPVHRLSFNVSTEADSFRATYYNERIEELTTRLLETTRP